VPSVNAHIAVSSRSAWLTVESVEYKHRGFSEVYCHDREHNVDSGLSWFLLIGSFKGL
jgi:hypothetical protein